MNEINAQLNGPIENGKENANVKTDDATYNLGRNIFENAINDIHDSVHNDVQFNFSHKNELFPLQQKSKSVDVNKNWLRATIILWQLYKWSKLFDRKFVVKPKP